MACINDCSASTSSTATSSMSRNLATLPAEVLLNIFDQLDSNTLCGLRKTNRRFNSIVDYSPELKPKFEPRTSDRFVVTIDPATKLYKFHSVTYRNTGEKALTFTAQDMLDKHDFSFVFRQLKVRRIIFEHMHNGTLTDLLINFLLDHVELSPEFNPIAVTFRECDMLNLSSDAMLRLLRLSGKNLVQFTMNNVANVRSDTFTNEHAAQFDLKKMNSLTITCISMAAEHKYLSLTDELFVQLHQANSFPVLQLHSCGLTTVGLSLFFDSWVKTHNTESFSNLVCTFKDCPGIVQNELSRICHDWPLEFSTFVEREEFLSVSHAMNTFTVNFAGEHTSVENTCPASSTSDDDADSKKEEQNEIKKSEELATTQ
uniref:F-box domain-containing protein n=1 Tax=Panagrellus redivivus TaxID=6233 RepID=A0A7E4W7Y8_PANRE